LLLLLREEVVADVDGTFLSDDDDEADANRNRELELQVALALELDAGGVKE
jgi:hypothetical protein